MSVLPGKRNKDGQKKEDGTGDGDPMKCPKCGFDNKENARFCKECGSKLAMSRDEEIYEKSKQPEAWYTERKESYREEYDSGETIYQKEDRYVPGHYEKKSSRGILIVAAALLVVCIGGAAGMFFFLSHNGGEKKAVDAPTTTETMAENTANKQKVEDSGSEETSGASSESGGASADTRATGSTVAIGSGDGDSDDAGTVSGETSEEQDGTQVLEDTGADSYDYADITSADDFNGVYLDSDYSIVYPKNFFKGVNVIDGGYELYTADRQVTLTVTKKEADGDTEKALKKIHKQYRNLLGTDKENNGVDISPGDDTLDGWRHTIVAGNEQANPGKGVYMIAAADDTNIYTQVFEYTDTSGGQEYCPQNYVIECLYRGCSFSFTSHPKIRSYDRYMQEGNDILND